MVRTQGTAKPPALSWSVTGPGGGPATVVPGRLLASSDWAMLGGAGIAGTMLDAAVGTGQVSTRIASATRDGIVARCVRGEVAVFHGQFALSFLQSCGVYRVEAVAQGVNSPAPFWSTFDDVCYTSVGRDFETIQWGNVAAGQEQWLRGDLAWSDVAAMHPTLRNDGNMPARIAIAFDALSPAGAGPGSERIEKFAACLGKPSNPLQCIDSIPSGLTAEFGRPQSVLCPGDIARLDVGLLPGASVAAGSYTGSLRIVESGIDGDCPASFAE